MTRTTHQLLRLLETPSVARDAAWSTLVFDELPSSRFLGPYQPCSLPQKWPAFVRVFPDRHGQVGLSFDAVMDIALKATSGLEIGSTMTDQFFVSFGALATYRMFS